MKIGMVHLSLASEAGDPRMFFCLAQAFTRAGHAVIIYTAQFDPQYFPKLHAGLDIRVVSPRAPFESVRGASGFIDKVRERIERNRLFSNAAARIGMALEKDLNLLITQNDASYELGIFYKRVNPKARVAWIMNNPPFYLTAKDNFLLNIGSHVGALLAKRRIHRFLPGIDLIVVHDAERKKMVEQFNVPSVNLNIPVDFEAFAGTVKKIAAEKKTVHLLGIGSLSPARKFDDIIAAAAHLRKKGYDARVTLVCRDYWKDAVYREWILAFTNGCGMEPYVTFLFEGASEDELRRIQAESDVFIFPNTFTIWSMASFESMAAGLPLVVSRITSVAEVLKDGEEALFSDSEDTKDIARQVRRLVDDPALYARIGEAGQRYVREHLNWDAYARQFLTVATNNSITNNK